MSFLEALRGTYQSFFKRKDIHRPIRPNSQKSVETIESPQKPEITWNDLPDSITKRIPPQGF